MAQPAPSKGGIVAVRAKSFSTLPPSTLGFSCLIDPDEFEGKLSFKTNAHFNEAAMERLVPILQKDIDGLWPEFLKEADKAGKVTTKWAKPDAASWVEDHLKPFKEGTRIELPFLQFKNDAEYKDRKSAQMVRKSMKAWDIKGNLLDLPALKLGMGSTVGIVIASGIYISPLIKQPDITLKLQGLKVYKLVQWGGNTQMDETDQEELNEVLGDDFDVEDLAGFGAKSPSTATKASMDDTEELPF